MSLPTYFTAKGRGLVCSRSGWGTDDTLFYLVAGPTLESHEDRNQGHFGLYRGGWLAAQAKLVTQSGLAQSVFESNCLQFGTAPQAWTQAGVVLATEDTPAYTWASADLTAAYTPQVTSYRRDYLFVKPNYLLTRDTFSGNAQPAGWWLQTLAMPSGNLAGRFQAGRLFGRSVTPGVAGTFAPYQQTTTQPVPSYRVNIPVTSPFVIALEAGSAVQMSASLGVPQNTPGLSGLPVGSGPVSFAGFVTGPGPWTFAVNAFSSVHMLAGLKPSTVYGVAENVFTSSPMGVLLFPAGAGLVTVTEGGAMPGPLTVTSVSPNPATSGQTVMATGSGFDPTMVLLWGTESMSPFSVTATLATFAAPSVLARATLPLGARLGAVSVSGPSLTVNPAPPLGHTYSLSIAADGTPSITRLS